jgi:hypothetical protein
MVGVVDPTGVTETWPYTLNEKPVAFQYCNLRHSRCAELIANCSVLHRFVWGRVQF